MFSNRRILAVLSLVLPLLAILVSGCLAFNLTPRFSHQGRLLDSSGNPVPDGDYTMQYVFYHSATGGTGVFTDTRTVTVEDGLFTTSIGSTSNITPSIFAQPTWMEIIVDGETLAPRQYLEGSPYAFSLVPDAIVRGSVVVTRTFAGLDDTGATMTVWNTNGSTGGGNGLVAANQAAPEFDIADDRRSKVAAFQAIAAGGDSGASPPTGAYGAKITSQNYRGMYAKAAMNYYAAVFDSNVGIQITGGGTCSGCTLAYVAQNDGTTAIEPGDFVAAAGVSVDPDLNMPIMLVSRATSETDPIIGVATGAMTRAPVGDFHGTTTGGFDAKGGPADAGEYLSVVVQGLVQMKAGGEALEIGDRVTLESGNVTLAAPGETTVARVISEVDAEGFAWVMFNGQ